MRIPSILSRPPAALALLGLAHLLANPLAAAPGDGQISGGKFDVLVYFTYLEADPEAWEPVFEEYSKLLLNATEGGLQLGRVEFTTCSSLADEADIWILNDNSGARAHIGGLGRSGQHITISQTHRSISGVALGQFGLAHETGHYVWSLYDEYLGFIGVLPGTSSQHYCSSASGIAACLMDGGTTIFPNNQRTEFCTDVSSAFAGTVHNAGIIDAQGMLVRTDQEFVYSTSCWRQIQRDGDAGLLHPAAEPLDIDLVHDPVTFVRDRFLGTLAMALLIDTSGSMSGDGRLEAAIMGSELALGMTRDGETQAVYAFDNRLRTLVAPQIVNASRRASAITKVGQLQASGGTKAGDALMEVAVEMGDVNGCRKFIVLLTDGVSDHPDVNESEVILELQSNDVLVYPVALGSFPDDAALMELASSTGGQYFHAPRPEDVPAIFAEIFTLAGGGAALGSFQGPGAPLGQVTAVEIQVPEGADALVVALSASRESEPVLGLVGPRGEAIRSDVVPPGVEMIQAGDVLLLRIFAPAAGEWDVGFATLRGVADRVTLFAAAESRLLSITTSTDRDVLSRTQLLHIETSVVSAVPVAGAEVRGSVLRPDGVRVALQLFDDGHPASGDLRAGDGVYSAYFSDVGDEGLYRFDLDVINIDGRAASNRECGLYGASLDDGEGLEEGAETRSIAPFRAHSSRTVLVQGNGSDLRQGAVQLQEHANGPDPTEGGGTGLRPRRCGTGTGRSASLGIQGRLAVEFPRGLRAALGLRSRRSHRSAAASSCKCEAGGGSPGPGEPGWRTRALARRAGGWVHPAAEHSLGLGRPDFSGRWSQPDWTSPGSPPHWSLARSSPCLGRACAGQASPRTWAFLRALGLGPGHRLRAAFAQLFAAPGNRSGAGHPRPRGPRSPGSGNGAAHRGDGPAPAHADHPLGPSSPKHRLPWVLGSPRSDLCWKISSGLSPGSKPEVRSTVPSPRPIP